jgi:hypothetical protein
MALRSNRARRAFMMVLLGGLLLAGVRASQAVDAQGATPDPLTLLLWPAGQGRIDVTQNGAPVGSCDFLYLIDNEDACRVEVAAGTPVTVTASPEPDAKLLDPLEQAALPDFPVPDPSFVRWTRSDCVGTGPCTFTPDGDFDWVGAVFTPLQLEVGIDDSDVGTGTVGVVSSAGTLASLPCGPTTFPDGTSECHGKFPADSSVVLVPSGEPGGTWGPGCASVAGDPPQCTVVMNNIRTFATLAFDGLVAPSFPFNITARLHIALTGSGHGRVTGADLDCGTQCTSDSVPYQVPVTLNAEAEPGSHFVRWEGVCSTDPVCKFSGGSETRIGAVFDGPADTTKTPVVTTTSPVVTTTGTPASITTAISASAFSPTIQKVGAKRLAGHRVVVVTLVVDRLAGATLRLLRNKRTIATTHWNLRPGRTLAKLRVPKSLKAGRFRLQVRIVAGSASRTFTTAVKVGR